MSFDSDTCFGKISGKPLKSYVTEYDATEASEYVKLRYGNEQIPYQCDVCGFWHLSPSDRQTPSKMCSCRDEKGYHKSLYPTKAIAERRKSIIREEQGIILHVYKCPVCEGWHLTHKR